MNDEKPTSLPGKQDEKERVGVYVCHCGTNISDTVDVEDVAVWAKNELAGTTSLCAPASDRS